MLGVAILILIGEAHAENDSDYGTDNERDENENDSDALVDKDPRSLPDDFLKSFATEARDIRKDMQHCREYSSAVR